MPIVTEQQLIDAAEDADTMEAVVNGAASPGTTTSRLGQSLKTLAKIEEEIETTGTGWLSLAQEYATQVEDTVVTGTSDYSALHHSAKAAASAVTAAAAANSMLWQDVVFVAVGDSPITLTQGDAGKLYAVDTSGGDVTFTLPTISGITLPLNLGIKKESSDSNSVIINAGGTDEIDALGATSKEIQVISGLTLVADDGTTPDRWTTVVFGALGGNYITELFEKTTDYTPDSTTQLTVTGSPGSTANSNITFDGVLQHKSTYSLAGSVFTFDAVIPDVDEVEITYGQSQEIGVPGNGTVSYTKIASGAIAILSNLISGTAGKLVTASVFKSFMDTYFPVGLRIVATANYDTSSTSLVVNSEIGMTAVRTAQGRLTITLDAAMVNDDYVVQLTGANANLVASGALMASTITNTTEFDVSLNNAGGSLRDGLFMITVIGEKA